MSKFTKLHTAIVGAFKSADDQFKKLEVTTVTTQNKAITALVDAHIVACTTTKAEYLKGNSVKNDARREVKELFESLAKAELIIFFNALKCFIAELCWHPMFDFRYNSKRVTNE
jgi:hypothetical protein